MWNFLSRSKKQSDEVALLNEEQRTEGFKTVYGSTDDTRSGSNDSGQGLNRQISNGISDNSREQARKEKSWLTKLCCCIPSRCMEKENEANKRKLNEERQAKSGQISNGISDNSREQARKEKTWLTKLCCCIPSRCMEKENEANKRELNEERQAKSGPSYTSVEDSLVMKEHPHESMRTDQFARLQHENDALRRRLIDSEVNEKDLRKQLQQAYDEADKTRERLSEMMSNRLTDNNPNIADLGDIYRPTNLAELMSELYDNQWTKAFDYFKETWQGEFSERACLDFLLNVIMEAFITKEKQQEVYTFCRRKVSEEWKATIKSLSLYTEKDQVLLKMLKDKRKAIAPETYPRILESCVETLKHLPLSNDPRFDITLEAKTVREYLQECVRLCWLMVVQDPQVYLYCYGWESSQSAPLLLYAREQGQPRYGKEDGNASHIEHQCRVVGPNDPNEETNNGGQEEGNAGHNKHQEYRDGLDDTNEETHYDGQEDGNAAHYESHSLVDGQDDTNDRDDKPETRGDGSVDPKTPESGMRNRVTFNKDHYREYTKRGAYLKYVVWPIVFLFEGGSVMQKGVAQGGD